MSNCIGWRRAETVPLDPKECYFAWVFGEGRGVLKKIDSHWIFWRREDNKDIIFPICCVENVFCLYPVSTLKRRKNHE